MPKEFGPKDENRIALGEKILSYEQAIQKIREAREKGLRVILAIGVFDVVHIGHIEYLRAAKQAGDLLFVGIENDDAVRLNKGQGRPFNSLEERKEFLTEFQSVDFVFGFEDSVNYSGDSSLYSRRFEELNPTTIAVSSWDPYIDRKKMQADTAGVGLVIIDDEKRNSTTKLLKMFGYE